MKFEERFKNFPRCDTSPKHTFEEDFRILLQSKGWKIIRSGWPDYAGTGPNGDKAFFELKDNSNDKISAHQKEMHEFLESCGVPVYIIGSNEFTSEIDLYRVFKPRKRSEVSVPFRIIQTLQDGPLIQFAISRRLRISAQLIAYHLKLLVKWGVLEKTKKNTYRIADEYSQDKVELQTLFDVLRSQCGSDEKAIEKLINHLLVVLSRIKKTSTTN